MSIKSERQAFSRGDIGKAPDEPIDQPPEASQPKAPEQPEYRDVSEDELKQILEAHQKWVASGGKEGKRANLSGANLQEASLHEANLQRADLIGANLQEANLLGAKLQEADLFDAKLQEADLRGAKLQEADLNGANLQGVELREANLEGAKGLTQEQLDGSCGDETTKLPSGLSIKLCTDDSKYILGSMDVRTWR